MCNFVPLKKLFAILMIMLYAVSSTGATVQLHYCCGKLKSIKLGTSPVKDCGSKHKMGTKPCCETKQVSSKNQDQQQVYTIAINEQAPAEHQVYFSEVTQLNYPGVPSDDLIVHSSPPLSQSLFIFNCVFRI
jgi:hypothetical protein